MKSCFVFAFVLSFVGHAAFGQGVFTPDPDGFPTFRAGTVECPDGFHAKAVCKELAKDFGYVRNGRGFEAAAGLITDGASIPPWAQPFIGKPHEKSFSRAATLHDHYVTKGNRVYSYLVTQRMFHDALVDSGVDKLTAVSMYAAVLVGGSKWTIRFLDKPEPCKVTPGLCIRNNLEDTRPDSSENFVASVLVDMEPQALRALVEQIIGDADEQTVDLDRIEREALAQRVYLGLDTPAPVKFGLSAK